MKYRISMWGCIVCSNIWSAASDKPGSSFAFLGFFVLAIVFGGLHLSTELK